MSEKRQEAVELLARGLNQSETAKKLGVTRQAVSYWWNSSGFKEEVAAAKARIQEEASKLTDPPAPLNLQPYSLPFLPPEKSLKAATYSFRDYYFNRELALLDEIEKSMMPHALEGSVRAAALLLKLSERRSKLLDLDLLRLPEVEAMRMLAQGGLIHDEMVYTFIEKMDEFKANLREALQGLSSSSATGNYKFTYL